MDWPSRRYEMPSSPLAVLCAGLSVRLATPASFARLSSSSVESLFPHFYFLPFCGLVFKVYLL